MRAGNLGMYIFSMQRCMWRGERELEREFEGQETQVFLIRQVYQQRPLLSRSPFSRGYRVLADSTLDGSLPSF